MRIIVIILILSIITGCISKQDPSQTICHRQAFMQAYREIYHSSEFGFRTAGGPGVRPSDIAFQLILLDPDYDLVKRFRSLFQRGTIHAKLYALFALYYIDNKAFNELAETIDKDKEVYLQFGCEDSSSTAGEVIKEIKRNAYNSFYEDFYWPVPTIIRAEPNFFFKDNVFRETSP